MKTTAQNEYRFDQKIVIYHNHEGREAWREGDQIYFGVLNSDYLAIDTPTLMAYMKAALSCLDEDNLLNLLPGEGMPRDARVGIVYKPSYAIVALSLYLKTTRPTSETSWMDPGLKKLMDAAFQYGIVGHGFEAGEMLRNTMLMFCRAGLKDYLESGERLSEVFNSFMTEMLKRIKTEISESHTSYAGGYSSRCPHLTRIPAEYVKMDIPVFVYGTLMKGERAASHLDNAYFAGEAILRDYALYELGHFPGIKESQSHFVLGQVFYVNSEMLDKLDAYEGEGSLYNRREVSVQLGNEPIQVFTYVYAGTPEVAPYSGRWKMQDDTSIWYAAYGSNLSESRFTCYIRGGICEQNNRSYRGCSDKTMWTESRVQTMKGRMYFANHSGSWGGKGVAFYSPEGQGTTVMRLYKITYGQLKEVQLQEGCSMNWYGRLVCLGFVDGLPVMTFTSGKQLEQNIPDDAYLNLIHDALVSECGISKREAAQYLKSCMKPFPAPQRR